MDSWHIPGMWLSCIQAVTLYKGNGSVYAKSVFCSSVCVYVSVFMYIVIGII